jgi:hypothetical protein
VFFYALGNIVIRAFIHRLGETPFLWLDSIDCENAKFLFCTVLIGVEGANPAKMYPHFIRAVLIQGSLFIVLRE